MEEQSNYEFQSSTYMGAIKARPGDRLSQVGNVFTYTSKDNSLSQEVPVTPRNIENLLRLSVIKPLDGPVSPAPPVAKSGVEVVTFESGRPMVVHADQRDDDGHLVVENSPVIREERHAPRAEPAPKPAPKKSYSEIVHLPPKPNAPPPGPKQHSEVVMTIKKAGEESAARPKESQEIVKIPQKGAPKEAAPAPKLKAPKEVVVVTQERSVPVVDAALEAGDAAPVSAAAEAAVVASRIKHVTRKRK